ncbi:MAG: hypothetical protein QW728_05720, partial [Thermoplasmata archaeon]
QIVPLKPESGFLYLNLIDSVGRNSSAKVKITIESPASGSGEILLTKWCVLSVLILLILLLLLGVLIVLRKRRESSQDKHIIISSLNEKPSSTHDDARIKNEFLLTQDKKSANDLSSGAPAVNSDLSRWKYRSYYPPSTHVPSGAPDGTGHEQVNGGTDGIANSPSTQLMSESTKNYAIHQEAIPAYSPELYLSKGDISEPTMLTVDSSSKDMLSGDLPPLPPDVLPPSIPPPADHDATPTKPSKPSPYPPTKVPLEVPQRNPPEAPKRESKKLSIKITPVATPVKNSGTDAAGEAVPSAVISMQPSGEKLSDEDLPVAQVVPVHSKLGVKRDHEMLQEIDNKLDAVEEMLPQIKDNAFLEEVKGKVKLAKTYRRSKNYPRAIKYLDEALSRIEKSKGS